MTLCDDRWQACLLSPHTWPQLRAPMTEFYISSLALFYITCTSHFFQNSHHDDCNTKGFWSWFVQLLGSWNWALTVAVNDTDDTAEIDMEVFPSFLLVELLLNLKHLQS